LTDAPRDAEFYRSLLSRFRTLSHVTIEVRRAIAKTMTASRSNTMISIYLVTCMILF